MVQSFLLRAAIPSVAFVALFGCSTSVPQSPAVVAAPPTIVADGCATFNRLRGLVPVAVSLILDMTGPEGALVRVAEAVVTAGCSAAGQAQILTLITGIEAALPEARARHARRFRRL